MQDGTVLFTRYFDVEQECPTIDQACGLFTETLPYNPQGVAVVLYQDDDELDRLAASDHAPTVKVTGPAGGTQFAATALVPITWQMDDEDSDPLSAQIMYFADNGAHWISLGGNITQTKLSVKSTDLPGGDKALVRVQVSDGYHTVEDVSDATFIVVDKAPRVLILSPSEGVLLEEGQSLVLNGQAVDQGGTPLTGEALSWSTDRDGLVGTGDTLILPSLPSRILRIILKATDAEGRSSQATVKVYVGYQNLLPFIRR